MPLKPFASLSSIRATCFQTLQSLVWSLEALLDECDFASLQSFGTTGAGTAA